MKKYTTLLILIIFSFQSAEAQAPYSKYLDQSCVWFEGYINILEPFIYSYSSLCIQGDTILFGEYYYKRYRTTRVIDYDASFAQSPPYPVVSDITSPPILYDYIREDSLNRFYRRGYYNLTEDLIADFNLTLNGLMVPASINSCTIEYR